MVFVNAIRTLSTNFSGPQSPQGYHIKTGPPRRTILVLRVIASLMLISMLILSGC